MAKKEKHSLSDEKCLFIQNRPLELLHDFMLHGCPAWEVGMTIGRLLILLDDVPVVQSRVALSDLCDVLPARPLPTFAVGLQKDVTLSLTAPYDDVIYNALEFLDVYQPEIWRFLHYTEVYLLLNGVVYEGQVPVQDGQVKLPKVHRLVSDLKSWPQCG